MSSIAAVNSRAPLAPADANISITKPPSDDAGTDKGNPAKRKAKEQEPVEEIDSDDERLNEITVNCDQVRRKINTFISNGGMKIGEFQTALGVSANSYRKFLGQYGKWKGMDSDTFVEAARFFKKRELKGLKMPQEKEATTSSSSSSSSTATTTAKGGAKRVKTGNGNVPDRYAVPAIRVEGEEEIDVPVFDTCDGVRKGLRAMLCQPDVTKAGLLREMATSYPGGRKLNTRSLDYFLDKNGPRNGNTSPIFYAGYVFLEKLRLKDGKPKTNFRLKMEEAWGLDGFDTSTPATARYICHVSTRPFVDRYGCLTFERI